MLKYIWNSIFGKPNPESPEKKDTEHNAEKVRNISATFSYDKAHNAQVLETLKKDEPYETDSTYKALIDKLTQINSTGNLPEYLKAAEAKEKNIYIEKQRVSNDHYEPAFYTPTPQYISVSDNPPQIGGIIKQISVEEFERNENCKFANVPYLLSQDRDLVLTSKENKTSAVPDVENCMFLNHSHFIISDVDTRVGKGLFLSPDASTIPKGSLITFYCGKYLSDYMIGVGEDMEYSYTLDLAQRRYTYLVYEKDINSNLVLFKQFNPLAVESTMYRGFSTYLQDLPTEEEISNVSDQKIQNKIATANLGAVLSEYEGFPIILFFALRNIEPGEQCGFTYGDTYKLASERCVFDLMGRVIGTLCDGDVEPDPSYSHLATAPKAPRIKGKQAYYYSNTTPLEEDYHNIFKDKLLHAIGVFIARHEKDSAETLNFLVQMRVELETIQTEDISQAFGTLKKFFHGETYKKLEANLTPLRKEIIKYMKQYNHNNKKKVENTNTPQAHIRRLP